MMRALVLASLILLASCDAAIVTPEIALLEIEPVADVLFPGDTTRLTAIVQNEAGEYIVAPVITWESTDTTVLRVTQDGNAIAVRPGIADIRMRYRASEAVHRMRVDSGFVFIEAGPTTTCAFKHAGDLFCWGRGRAFSDGTVAGTEIARRIPTELRFKQFSIGSNHMCAVTFDLKPYCWGYGERHAAGIGTLYFQTSIPTLVLGDHRFTEVSAAWEHSCGLTPEGVAYCWGRNGERQLGTTASGMAPARVETDLRFKQLQAAGSNTCGLTMDGDAYCWGHRDYLGVPTFTEHQVTPVRINIPKLRMFDSANDDPCGITPENRMYCWTNKVEHVEMVGQVEDVTVGGGHICVRDLTGRTLCYGKNTYGQLGLGVPASSATPIEPSGGLRFAQITAGANHTCGITDTGASYCWGYNYYGQLGNGSRSNANTPTRVLIPRD